MPKIIIEGCDNSGKSTLMGSIRKEFPHLSLNPSMGPIQEQDLSKVIRDQLTDLSDPSLVLYDRHHLISEAIYGPRLRNKNLYGSSYSGLLFKLLNQSPLIIWCCPPKEMVTEVKTEQMEGVVEKIGELYDDYESLLGTTKEIYGNRLTIIKFDYTRHSTSALVATVGSYIQDYARILGYHTEIEKIF